MLKTFKLIELSLHGSAKKFQQIDLIRLEFHLPQFQRLAELEVPRGGSVRKRR